MPEKLYSELPEIFIPSGITTDKDLVENYAGSLKYSSHLILWIRLNIDQNYGLESEEEEIEE